MISSRSRYDRFDTLPQAGLHIQLIYYSIFLFALQSKFPKEYACTLETAVNSCVVQSVRKCSNFLYWQLFWIERHLIRGFFDAQDVVANCKRHQTDKYIRQKTSVFLLPQIPLQSFHSMLLHPHLNLL